MIVLQEFWWNTAFVTAQAVLLGRRGYIMYKEEDAPASEKFLMRAQSLPYITLWMYLAVLTVILAFLSREWGDAVNVVGVFAAEYVAICMWRHYFEHGKVVGGLIKETRKRMLNLLVEGLGLSESELEQHLLKNETAVVAMLSQKFKEKQWRHMSAREKDELLYDIGLLSAKVLQDHLWEGVLYGAVSFFSEWRAGLKVMGKELGMPQECKDDMKGKDGSVNKHLLCVAIMIANEDKHLRVIRGPNPEYRAGRQFCAARIARRKAAAEGILRWPDCMLPRFVMELDSVKADVSDLKRQNSDGEFVRVESLKELPSSVLYTLKEILWEGYIKARKGAPTEVKVTFHYGSMVFPKELWNPLRVLARKPFRYITSATWMSGNVAFVVEQREALGTGVVQGGSGSLKGTLNLLIEMKENEEQGCWVDEAKAPNVSAWGDLEGFDDHEHVSLLNQNTVFTIKLFWHTISYIIALRSKIKVVSDKLPISMKEVEPAKKSDTTVFGSTMDVLLALTAAENSHNHSPKSTSMEEWFTQRDPVLVRDKQSAKGA